MLLAFFMIDIDHFKFYNDTYGHVAGDSALREIGTLFKNMFKRGSDYSFRMGGEEFSLLLEIKDENEAEIIANMVLEEVRNLKIVHSGNGDKGYLTVSIGIEIIEFNKDIKSPQEIYLSADKQLYLAKESGRDCCKISTELQ